MEVHMIVNAECSMAQQAAARAAAMARRLAAQPNDAVEVRVPGAPHDAGRELPVDRRLAFLESTLQRDPAVFLERWGRHLTADELNEFAASDDYEVRWHVRSIARERASGTGSAGTRAVVRNRRFHFMQDLVQKGEYFSDAAMRERNPAGFEDYIGRHMSQAEHRALSVMDPDSALSHLPLAGFLMNALDERLRREGTELMRGAGVRPEDAADDGCGSDGEDDADSEDECGPWGGEERALSRKDKARLRAEFLRLMEERFLDGRDTDIDYGPIDANEAYDDVDAMDRDAEEAYFDADDTE